MNTLHVESLLSNKYGYKPLPENLSQKYRQYYKDNIPDFLTVEGKNMPLFTKSGIKICDSYSRIVIGDYGAFVEFESEPPDTNFIIQPGQEYRLVDPKYSKNVKYIWLTTDDLCGIKIYLQKRTVLYADYIPGKYYVSVHEVYPTRGKES